MPRGLALQFHGICQAGYVTVLMETFFFALKHETPDLLVLIYHHPATYRGRSQYQAGNLGLVLGIKAFFRTEEFLSIQPNDRETFDLAAQLKAKGA